MPVQDDPEGRAFFETRRSHWGKLALGLLGLAFALLVGMNAAPPHDDLASRLYWSAVLGAGPLYLIVKELTGLLRVRPVWVVSDRGVVVRRIGLVRWDEIEGFFVVPGNDWRGRPRLVGIQIRLVDADRIRKAGPLARLKAWWARRIWRADIFLKTTWVGMTYHDVMREFVLPAPTSFADKHFDLRDWSPD